MRFEKSLPIGYGLKLKFQGPRGATPKKTEPTVSCDDHHGDVLSVPYGFSFLPTSGLAASYRYSEPKTRPHKTKARCLPRTRKPWEGNGP